MTQQEAIEIITNAIQTENMTAEQDKALAIVQKATEKQIAKKYEVFNGACCCPNCNILFGNLETLKTLISWEMPYCKYCGQALDWEQSNVT